LRDLPPEKKKKKTVLYDSEEEVEIDQGHSTR